MLVIRREWSSAQRLAHFPYWVTCIVPSSDWSVYDMTYSWRKEGNTHTHRYKQAHSQPLVPIRTRVREVHVCTLVWQCVCFHGAHIVY